MSEQSFDRIAVIGAGSMGEALIAALISYGVKPASICISEKRKERSDELVTRYGVSVADLAVNVASADALLLVVKPQDMESVLTEITAVVQQKTLLISFAAGKTIDFIAQHVSASNPIIRVMPNTPTLVGEGMAGISSNKSVSAREKEFVLGFLGATGSVVEVPEELQNAVTATSGSGPAYFFRFVEAMIAAATKLGLSQEVATQLTIQTIVGSAKLLETSGKSATTLRENVTSPNGTTAAALAQFNEAGIDEIVKKAMFAAHKRAIELA